MNIFVNLPVADPGRSVEFFRAIGWTNNPNFTDENGACIVIDEDKFLMAVRQDFFDSFLSEGKRRADPATTTGTMVSFDLPSREAVDAFIDGVAAAGGRIGGTQDLGFMYQRQFDDPDGNHFEPFWMDPAAAESGPPAE